MALTFIGNVGIVLKVSEKVDHETYQNTDGQSPYLFHKAYTILLLISSLSTQSLFGQGSCRLMSSDQSSLDQMSMGQNVVATVRLVIFGAACKV